MSVTQGLVTAAIVMTALVGGGWLYWWRRGAVPKIGRRRSRLMNWLSFLAAEFWVLILLTVGPWGVHRQLAMVVVVVNFILILVAVTSLTGFSMAGKPGYRTLTLRSTPRGRSGRQF